jgi:hypothetical protein
MPMEREARVIRMPFTAAAACLLRCLLATAREKLREDPGRRVLTLSRRRDRQHDRSGDLLHAEVEERATAALQAHDCSDLVSCLEAVRETQLAVPGHVKAGSRR